MSDHSVFHKSFDIYLESGVLCSSLEVGLQKDRKSVSRDIHEEKLPCQFGCHYIMDEYV